MTQNKSHAVMSQRNEPRDSLEDFPTPPWAARAICEQIASRAPTLRRVWEPACNRGYMARPLGEYFTKVYATDVANYGYVGQSEVIDFLFSPDIPCDWIITNPPFRLAEEFALRALRHEGRPSIAFLVRTQFLEGVGRYERLFRPRPPSAIYQFAERVPMVKGRYDPKASTATSYCWVMWERAASNTRFLWIPPSRKRLERPGDVALIDNAG